MRRYIVLLSCVFFICGCAQSLTQHKAMWSAITDRFDAVGYSKSFILNKFGYPASTSVSRSDGKRVEIWTYQTNIKDKYVLLNARPTKTKYLKITFIDNRATHVDFE